MLGFVDQTEHPAGIPNLGFVPDVKLGLVSSGEFELVQAPAYFAGSRAFVIGIPGAYTPVCSEKHVPALIRDADRLRARGFDIVACITSNDPFVVRHWAQDIDPKNKLVFLSDGNLDFATALGLVVQERGLLLGSRSQRYLMVIHDTRIEKLRAEKTIFDLSCTSPSIEYGTPTSTDGRQREYI